jgi:hypothetical protein
MKYSSPEKKSSLETDSAPPAVAAPAPTMSSERTGKTAQTSKPAPPKERYTLKGKQAELRVTETSPVFEVPLPGNAPPSELLQLVRLDVKPDRREIEVFQAGAKLQPPKYRVVDVSIEELPDQGNKARKSFRVKTVKPIVAGEYALVVQGRTFYDFGVDPAKK